MSDVTNDWAGGNRSRDAHSDPTRPAPAAEGLVADLGDRTPPAPTAPAAESKSFQSLDSRDKAHTGAVDAEESLLRATLETVRVKAEELREQASDWTKVRQEQALDFVDDKPITAIAAAFGVGLLIGALLSR